MSTAVEQFSGRVVGVIREVSVSSFSILIEPSAPQAVALNVGTPVGFPRINNYLLAPHEGGATFGIITAARVQEDSGAPAKGATKSELVNLPADKRIITVVPVGTLVHQTDAKGTRHYRVTRGVDIFPSVGDPVLIPDQEQLQAMVEGEGDSTEGRVQIGTSPTAGGAPVFVDPNKLFGRHLAILGNTGSGKSCTVAGLIRWSVQAAKEKISRSNGTEKTNARFIILDPNGEYAKAFQDTQAKVFVAECGPQSSKGESGEQLEIPAWMWNGREWATFVNAAPGVQQPVLFDAIRRLRSNPDTEDLNEIKVSHTIGHYRDRLRGILISGAFAGFPKREDCAAVLKNLLEECRKAWNVAQNPEVKEQLRVIGTRAGEIKQSAFNYHDTKTNQDRHHDFQPSDIDSLLEEVKKAATLLGLPEEFDGPSENTPHPFSVASLPQYVEAIGSNVAGRDMSQFIDSLNLRIRNMLATEPLSSIAQSDSSKLDLRGWLNTYVRNEVGEDFNEVTILDLSLVPSETVHIVVAVIARMILEALQRYHRETDANADGVLPTVLVLDEAHTFLHENLLSGNADRPSPGRVCCEVFERIAREGRKFGLGLVVASQRPSEISPTVVSQCNSFILHRIVNNNDQQLVRRLVPDGLGNLLGELPNLPSRRGILLGWGAPAPLVIETRELQQNEQPRSPDPDFWEFWTKEEPVEFNWKDVVEVWDPQLRETHSSDTDEEAEDNDDDELEPGESDGHPFS